MTDIIFGIDLITKTATIKKKILKSLIAQLKIKIPALRPRIESIVKGLIGKYIKFSPEYLSFGGGILQKELGVLDPYSSLDDMLSILVNTVTVNTVIVNIVTLNTVTVNIFTVNIVTV